MRRILLALVAVMMLVAMLFSGLGAGKVQRASAQEYVCWNVTWLFTAGPVGFTPQLTFYDANLIEPGIIDAGTFVLAPNETRQVTWVAAIPVSWIANYGTPGEFTGQNENILAGFQASDDLIYDGRGSGCDAGGGINDGRLCLWDYYAVYTTGDAIDVYGLWESQGYFVLRVTKAELDAAPGAEGVNTLIKSSNDGLVQVYRLGTSDLLQVHAGLDFVRFSGLPASGVVCEHIDLP